MKTLLLSIIGIVLIISPAKAQFHFPLCPPVEPIQDSGTADALFQPAGSPFVQTGAAIAEAITPDIQALAQSLGNDPTRIFNYVHDQIRFEFYFASRKGAELTLLEQSGNDFDQCALLSALLQVAGYSPTYQLGMMTIPYDSSDHQDIHHWLGLNFYNTNGIATSNYMANIIGDRGGWGWGFIPGDTNDFVLQRLWVTVNIGGTTNYLDPSFKITEPINSINLSSAMGLDTNGLMTSAGGTDTSNYVSGLSEASLRGTLQTYNSNLLSYLSNNLPNATIPQIIGGEEIVSSVGQPLATTLQFGLQSYPHYPLQNWTNQPTNFMGTLSVSIGGTNQVWYTPQLQGQRVSLTFSSNGLAQLWLEDSNVLQTTNTGTTGSVSVVISATHPYGGWDSNQFVPIDAGLSLGFDVSSTNFYQTTNANYAITYAFDASQKWLQQRQKKLSAYLQQGLSNGSRQVTTETLNVMGLGYMVQTELMQELFCQQAGQLLSSNHRYGRLAQEPHNGYYVDILAEGVSPFPTDGFSPSDIQNVIQCEWATGYFKSAMEHGIIEQLQNSNLVAASTVKMLEIAVTNGQAVYLATSNNWSAVNAGLSSYSSSSRTSFASMAGSGFLLLIPQYGSNTIAGPGSWDGTGYVAVPPALSLDYLGGWRISGDFNGGYVSSGTATVNPPFIAQVDDSQPNAFNPGSSTLPLPTPTGADPVNMVDGSFQISSTDLSLGGVEPRGLNLTRYYSSARRNSNPAGMSPGWLHNYYCTAMALSDPEAGLGGGNAQQMTAAIVATCSALNLYNHTNPDPKNWVVTALIAKWGIDQLINNAVSVNLGKDTVQFIKQPNGSFIPPGNCTMSLILTNAGYWLQERHGRTFKFGTNTLLTNIVDQYGQSMKLAYNSSNLVTNVTDWVNRSLIFTYTGGVLTSVADSTGRSISYGYSGSNLVAYTDPGSKTNGYVYDTNNDVIATFDALGRLVVTNIYDGMGHVTTQFTQGDTNKTWQVYTSGACTLLVDPAGGQQVYTFDNKFRQIAFQDALGNGTQTVYDGQDHIVQTISPLNETNQFFYDAKNNLIETIDPLGFSNTFVYDAQNNLITSTDARGIPSHFGYNAQFSLIGSTNGNGDWADFGFNSDGTLFSRQNADGTVFYGYDGYGQLNNIFYPDGSGGEEVEGFLNTVIGDVLSHTDENGFVTTFAYDQRRQLTNTTRPTNLMTAISYDTVGNASTITDARGFTTSNLWSVTRHLLSTTLPLTPQGSPVISNAYDGRDWLVSTKNPLNKITYFTNDPAQRLTATKDPLSRLTAFGYDADGRQTNATDALSERTSQSWDARGDLLNIIDGASNVVGRAYDGTGNLIRLTNRNNKIWQFQYDGANRLSNTISPLGYSFSRIYGENGLVETKINQAGNEASFNYDERGRLYTLWNFAGINDYAYDSHNNITSIFEYVEPSSIATVYRTYDAYNRITSSTDFNGNFIQYRYDANNNLTNLIYPGSRTVKYFYDSNNRVTNITDWFGRITTFAHDLAGHLTSVARPNNTLRTMSYDDDGELTNIIDQTMAKFPICFYTLHYNAVGRTDWEFKGPPPHANSPVSRTMTFDNDNRLATFNGSGVGIDANGNMTNGPGTNSTFETYTYDAGNELTAAGGVTYQYDGMGNRLSATSGTNVTAYVIDPQSFQTLMRIEGSKTNYYIYGDGLLYEIDETSATTNAVFYHFDSRGSTVTMSDSNGAPTDIVEYGPYGTTAYRYGTDDTPFLYNGQYGVQTDPNGLLYMRARYYNPYISRFLNADPSGFGGGLNFYAFCYDNPVSNEDPFGLQVPGPVEIAIGFGPGFGQSVGQYNSQVQIVAQQALAIEGSAAAGVVVGGTAAFGVGAGAVGLVSLGVPQSVVTGGLLLTGAAGVVAAGYSIYNNPSVNNIAFMTGSFGGGLLAGGASANYVASALSPSGYQPSGPASLASDLSMVWRDSSGNPNPFSMFPAWISPDAEVGPMSTGPSALGAAGAIAGAGTGTAAAAQLFGGTQPQSPTGK